MKNQYPVHFIDDLFNKTLNKILEQTICDPSSEDSVIDTVLDNDACVPNIEEKDKFLFFLNYRGNPSDHFVIALKKLNAPCRVVMTLCKTKSIISKLKTPVPHMLQNNLVYKIMCPG